LYEFYCNTRQFEKSLFLEILSLQNYCKVTASCKPKEIITMDRCFWEELPIRISIFKNDEIIEYLSVTLTVGPHLMVTGVIQTMQLENN
jgi:hypothetical protein